MNLRGVLGIDMDLFIPRTREERRVLLVVSIHNVHKELCRVMRWHIPSKEQTLESIRRRLFLPHTDEANYMDFCIGVASKLVCESELEILLEGWDKQ